MNAAEKVSIGNGVRIDTPWRVQLDKRVTLESDVWVKLVATDATLTVGEYTFVGRGTEFDIGDQIHIGSNVLIAPRVFITDHSHNIAPNQKIGDQGCASAAVTIGDDVWIGTNAVILPGVSIGKGAVIGAGAVVRSDVPEYEIWAGVPAKRIRSRHQELNHEQNSE